MTQTDELLARHEPPSELQEQVEQKFSEDAQNGRKPRRVRSDKGVPKGPKLVNPAPPPAAAISAQQASELKRLAAAMCVSQQLLAEAQRSNLQAVAEYFDYVDSLAK